MWWASGWGLNIRLVVWLPRRQQYYRLLVCSSAAVRRSGIRYRQSCRTRRYCLDSKAEAAELFADLDVDFFESGDALEGFENAVLQNGDHTFFDGGLFDGD